MIDNDNCWLIICDLKIYQEWETVWLKRFTITSWRFLVFFTFKTICNIIILFINHFIPVFSIKIKLFIYLFILDSIFYTFITCIIQWKLLNVYHLGFFVMAAASSYLFTASLEAHLQTVNLRNAFSSCSLEFWYNLLGPSKCQFITECDIL